ncbi:MAG TPA: hypothetical protein VFG04_03380 [Planctomycetaceae bacterium]|nr:hypothetical protein [Planctomycetaceae bacterium]
MNQSFAACLMMAALAGCSGADSLGQDDRDPSMTRVPVKFSGGHETDRRDHGRPVVLIAAALGVPADVFRQAFSHVRPAPAGSRPSREQVQQNKEALLNALGPYGVTNDRLDEVSDHYRYVRRRGQLWPTKPAAAYAEVKGGKIERFVVTNGGAGYSSAPSVSVPGFDVATKVELSFGKKVENNGSVSAIVLIKGN